MTWKGDPSRRRCTTCQTEKPLTDFYLVKNKKSPSQCKACESVRKKQRRLDRKTVGVIALRGTCSSCGETKLASAFRINWAHESGLEFQCRLCVSNINRQRQFDMTAAEYAVKLHEQEGVCAICGKSERTRANNGRLVKNLAVDHNHDTGQLRGLLCAQCNKGLGNFGDDASRLMAAAAYLLQYDPAMRAANGRLVEDLGLPKDEVI